MADVLALQENNAKDDIRIDKNLCFIKSSSLVFQTQNKNKVSGLFFSLAIQFQIHLIKIRVFLEEFLMKGIDILII